MNSQVAGNSRVLVGSGLLSELGARVLGSLPQRPRCALIADENVNRLYAAAAVESLRGAGINSQTFTLPAGERSKSLAHVGAICDQMSRAGLDRTSFVVALGGGVIGDLAGFIASVYHRGIPWVNVPTTVLAQVDSCIGGKTGLNTAAGKNLIGSFHQPALVVADVDTLQTLPRREWNEGFAEVIKHGIIRDAALFESLPKAAELEPANARDLVPLIRRNIEIKAAIVAADERESTGERALLNFGHTVGHAIETAAGYGEMLHGEAISLGIVAASDLSTRKAGLPDDERRAIVAMLNAFQLPTQLPRGISRDKIKEALRFDKKFERGEIRFVVTPKIGSAYVATDVTFADLEHAIDSL
jgi:3-dehydroquinate synthase